MSPGPVTQAAEELRQKLLADVQGAAMRQIRSMMVRMVKGELGMHLDCWKMNHEIHILKVNFNTLS